MFIDRQDKRKKIVDATLLLLHVRYGMGEWRKNAEKKKMKSSPTSCSVQVATTIRYTRALRKRTDRRRKNEKWRKGERERKRESEGGRKRTGKNKERRKERKKQTCDRKVIFS